MILPNVQALVANKQVMALILPICQEIERRKVHPGVIYVPSSHPDRNQAGFHRSQAPRRLVFGGNRSGKSRCAAQEIKWFFEGAHPFRDVPKAAKIYVISANYRTLKEGIFEHLKTILSEWKIAKYGPIVSASKVEIPSYIISTDGAEVHLISGQGREDARRKLQSADVDLMVIDEEIDGATWVEVEMRCLTKGSPIIISATLERSEDWLLKLEEIADAGDEDTDLFRLSTEVAVEEGHADRRAFDRMKRELDDETASVRLYGGSRRRMGLIYPEFSRPHICAPFPIPNEWTRYCTVDPGWRTCAILWIAVAPDERAYVYREGYYHAQTYHYIAQHIFSSEGFRRNEKEKKWERAETTEPIRVRWMDPAGFHRDVAGGYGIGAMLAADYGIYCSPAQAGPVTVGIEKVKQWLKLHEEKREDGIIHHVPRLRVFKNCTSLIREFGLYKWAEDRGYASAHERKDGPIKRNDHALDALRYAVCGGLDYSGPKDEDEFSDAHPPWEGTPVSEQMETRMRLWWASYKQRKKYPGKHVAGLGSGF